MLIDIHWNLKNSLTNWYLIFLPKSPPRSPHITDCWGKSSKSQSESEWASDRPAGRKWNQIKSEHILFLPSECEFSNELPSAVRPSIHSESLSIWPYLSDVPRFAQSFIIITFLWILVQLQISFTIFLFLSWTSRTSWIELLVPEGLPSSLLQFHGHHDVDVSPLSDS